MDALLKWGADEKLKATNGKIASDLVGKLHVHHVENHWEVTDPEQKNLVQTLLARAPAERAWRRRGLFLMCCSRHGRAKERGSGGTQPKHMGLVASHPDAVVAMLRGDGIISAKLAKIADDRVGGQREDSSCDGGEGMADDLAGLGDGKNDAGNLHTLVARVLHLEEEGIFRAIVCFL